VAEGLTWLAEKNGGEEKIEAFELAIGCEGGREFIRKGAPLECVDM
jgi:hypothetical protein